MNILLVMDLRNYDDSAPRTVREAARAIISVNGKIALVKSEKAGYFKFPGGGIEMGETHSQALIREIREETGLSILPDSIKAYGAVKEIRKSHYANEIFEHTSYYYFCDIQQGELSPKCLDEYEAELGYQLEYVNIDEAIRVNSGFEHSTADEFIKRETNVLRLLLEHGKRETELLFY